MIRKFNPKDIETECFGGSNNSSNSTGWESIGENSKNAYLLVYEKIVKDDISIKYEKQ